VQREFAEQARLDRDLLDAQREQLHALSNEKSQIETRTAHVPPRARGSLTVWVEARV